jgi:elongation factor G
VRQHSAAIGTAPAPRPPAEVRNVAVVGHSGAGKTTLVEALLAAAGAITRAGDVQDGTTTCDSEDVERRLGHSVALAVAALEHAGTKVNLLDTPGSPDFVGELRAGLRAADGVLFVVSAAGGLDAVTSALWAECERAGMPRAVVVTQLDRARADFDETVALCQRCSATRCSRCTCPCTTTTGRWPGCSRCSTSGSWTSPAAGEPSATPTRSTWP